MPDKPSIPPEEVNDPIQRSRSWIKRLAVAFRGVKTAFRLESNFFVHSFGSAMAILAGAILGISRWEWCLIVFCTAAVMSAELFNTSIERIARAITCEENADIRDALDIASGAVLVVALGAATIGVLVLGIRAYQLTP